ncbi:hypothetical protein [Chryseotalea sanaruensis]|nr:hypothetical protein [Chryseotalea sanaruensis]
MTVPKYLISRLLFVSLLLIGLMTNARSLQITPDCDQFNVKVTVDQNNKVVLEVTGLKGKQLLHLVGNKGFAKQNISEEELNNLGKGSYVLIVIDQKGSENFCQKHVDFTIN